MSRRTTTCGGLLDGGRPVAFIPFADNPGVRRRFPFVNYALILANVAVFVYELTQPDQGQCFTQDYALIPNHILALPANPLATYAGCAGLPAAPILLTLITSMFLHAGLLHIGGNMIYLWVFGDNVEDRLGHFWYLIFYLVCGLAASAAQIAATVYSQGDLNVINLGASGAIAGILGAYLVFFPGAKVKTLVFLGIFFTITTLSAFIVIGFWFVLQLADAYLSVVPVNGAPIASGGVAYFAHVGGFVLGMLIAVVAKLFSQGPRPNTTYPAWPVHPDVRSSTYR
jgi:membrane associated rhomboid family serine protease